MNTQYLEYIYNLSATLLCVSIYTLSIVFLVTWVLNHIFDVKCPVMRIVNTIKKWAYVILFPLGILSIIGIVFALLTFPV